MRKYFKKLFKIYYSYILSIYKKKLLLAEFYKDFEKYNKMSNVNQQARKENLFPCLFDKSNLTEIEPIYFFQDTWAFEQITKNNPIYHVDVGSHHTFVGFLSKIIDTTMIDIRPLSVNMPSIKFIKGSILELPFDDNSIESLSSICVIEHIGLGRYGDNIDPLGSEKAFSEISRILKIGANFYMSVPIEEINKVYFNAHRAFNEDYLLSNLLNNFQVIGKRYIYGNEFTELKKNGFGVGCYHLKKNN